ncbi:histidine kinase [Phenylobacterium sp.]|uniref:sensor histidine kinase n=1 Tax=Phenylobacterium sp. TaxID=1871053 RepID=UPI00301E1343
MTLGWTSLSDRTRTALRASMVLWTLGYALVIAVITIFGARTATVDVAISAGLWCVAVVQAATLYALWRRMEVRPPVGRWIVMLCACLAAAALQTAIDISIYYALAQTVLPEWSDWATMESGRVGGVWILYSWTFLLNLSLYWALSLSEQAREQGRRAAEAEAAAERAELTAQRAQLAALRLQLNPHFLFNTLNAISTLVMERDVVRADQMIERLSDFLRASLSMDPAATIPLGEEMDIAQAYLEIEAVRFEGRLAVELDCPEALRTAQVPGFTLQPLVENAIKYAVAPSLRPVTVQVSAEADGETLILRVADDGDPVDPGMILAGAGVGLANTRARLKNLFGERGTLSAGRGDSGYLAEVRMPLVPRRSGARSGVAA